MQISHFDLNLLHVFQQPVLGSGARLTTGIRPGPGRLQTGIQIGAVGSGDARPMTAVRAAGYTAYGGGGAGVVGGGSNFDPMRQKDRGPAPPLEKSLDESPEEKIRLKEKKVR